MVLKKNYIFRQRASFVGGFPVTTDRGTVTHLLPSLPPPFRNSISAADLVVQQASFPNCQKFGHTVDLLSEILYLPRIRLLSAYDRKDISQN